MTTLRWTRDNLHQAIYAGGIGAITLHLVVASLVAMDGGTPERQAMATLALLVGVIAAGLYGSSWRPVIAIAYGLSAAMTGISIHLIHVVQLGFHDTDFTGVPMIVAGVLLFVTGTTTLLRMIDPWWKRLALVPALPVLFFYFLFPVTFTIAITNVARPAVCCDNTPAHHGFAYEDVSFENEAGLKIAAWYVPSQNGAAIITVHGAGSNRVNTMDEAVVLAHAGYGVLMIDVEGFGESEGRSNSYGWLGARDVHAAVKYLQERQDVDPDRIGGLGLSMGGEVMIQAAGENAAIRAIVAEGATGRSGDDFREAGNGEFLLMEPFFFMVEATTRITTGHSAPPPLKQMVAQIAPRDVLLISADYGEEPELSALYVEVGGPTVQHWAIPEADHVGALDNHPDEYEERVIKFFDDALGTPDERVRAAD